MQQFNRDRRRWLAAVRDISLGAAAAAAGMPAAQAQGTRSAADETGALRQAFDGMVDALNRGDLDGFWAAFHPSAIMIDEDAPWRFDLPGIKDHIAFHGGNLWEGFAWRPRDPRFRVVGSTGVVAGAATFRGKPKDAGYRLRHLLWSQGWIRDDGAWRTVLWHQSPVVGHVTRGSPG
jgi:hypothetical protein